MACADDRTKVPGLTRSSGRIGMTFLPGKRDPGSTGQQHRDLTRDTRWLRYAHDVEALVLLVEDHELRDCQVPDIADVMAAHGIDLIRHPIDAGSGPADRPGFGRLLDDILARVAHGHNVVVACRAGLARTGTVVACLLRDAGLDGPTAIEA